MQKWEYHLQPVVKIPLDYSEYLEGMGNEGWEFAGVLPGDPASGKQFFVLFKRPVERE
jgi:hypothetical protein